MKMILFTILFIETFQKNIIHLSLNPNSENLLYLKPGIFFLLSSAKPFLFYLQNDPDVLFLNLLKIDFPKLLLVNSSILFRKIYIILAQDYIKF